MDCSDEVLIQKRRAVALRIVQEHLQSMKEHFWRLGGKICGLGKWQNEVFDKCCSCLKYFGMVFVIRLFVYIENLFLKKDFLKLHIIENASKLLCKQTKHSRHISALYYTFSMCLMVK